MVSDLKRELSDDGSTEAGSEINGMNPGEKDFERLADFNCCPCLGTPQQATTEWQIRFTKKHDYPLRVSRGAVRHRPTAHFEITTR